MRAFVIALATLVAFSASSSAQAPAGKTLDVYFVDVEGGHATLYVSPSGESMLVDAGYAGFDGRDAGRIAAAAALAGVTQIDYLVVTHFHAQTRSAIHRVLSTDISGGLVGSCRSR